MNGAVNDALIFDASDAEFDDAVITASATTPILVDFWADWCAPCRVLGPILEDVVRGLAGRVRLAKVDVDRNPRAAERYRVSGIPSVKLFANGAVVGEFLGALPAGEIRRFLAERLPSPAAAPLRLAASALDEGALERAERHLNEALALDPESSDAAIVRSGLLLARGETAAARETIERIDPGGPFDALRVAIIARLDLAEAAAPVGGREDPLAARFSCGRQAVGAGRYREALEHFLAILEENRAWNGGAARDAMVKVFDVVGPRSELADEFRDRMARLLY